MGALLLVLPFALVARGEDNSAKRGPASANPAFETLKERAGTRVAVGDGKPTDRVVPTFKVTAR